MTSSGSEPKGTEREIAPALTPAARTLAERLERFVSSTTKKLAARLTA